jgi:hypothetical protein
MVKAETLRYRLTTPSLLLLPGQAVADLVATEHQVTKAARRVRVVKDLLVKDRILIQAPLMPGIEQHQVVVADILEALAQPVQETMEHKAAAEPPVVLAPKDRAAMAEVHLRQVA